MAERAQLMVEASQADFLQALQRVLGIVERRHTLPVLANVLIRQTGRTVELTTTDLELQIRTQAELGSGTGASLTTVNARKLADILRAMPAGQAVTLAAGPNRVTLCGGGSRFSLQTLPADTFPLVREAVDFGPAIALPQAVLGDLIDQVAFAMAVHDIRYFLNGLLFVIEGRQLTLVATDGNRLALACASLEREMPRQQVILPRKAVLELQRLLRAGGTADATVQVRFAPAQAAFEFDGLSFVTHRVEGRFPDYRRVIPEAPSHALTLGREPLLMALQRAAILTSEKFRAVRLIVSPGSLRIASSNAQQEEADVEIAVDHAGAPIEIGFNVAYLLDALANTAAESLTMAWHNAQTGVLFTFAGREGFLYVVSPMRL